MKRSARKVVLFLLLGAILNIAVAWGCCYFASDLLATEAARKVIATDEEGRVSEYLDVSVAKGPGTIAYRVARIRMRWVSHSYVEDAADPDRVVPHWAQPSRALVPPPEEGHGVDTETTVGHGWPAYSMSWRVDSPTEHRAKIQIRMAIELGTRQGKWGLEHDLLPLCPIWPGFAINTIFYAAILWLLFAFPFAVFGQVRHRRRIKRGLCRACGHDLRGQDGDSKTCPECGKAGAGFPQLQGARE